MWPTWQPFTAQCNFAVFVSKMGSLPCTKMQQLKGGTVTKCGYKLQYCKTLAAERWQSG